MSAQANRRRPDNLLMGMLLGLGIGAPVLLGSSGVAPAWAGAAIGGAGLLGALIVLSNQGALKMRYIMLLGSAILAAASTGWLL